MDYYQLLMKYVDEIDKIGEIKCLRKQNRFIPYLREDRLPHIFCPGCGNGAIINAFLAAMEKAEMDFDNIAMVSGIGVKDS